MNELSVFARWILWRVVLQVVVIAVLSWLNWREPDAFGPLIWSSFLTHLFVTGIVFRSTHLLDTASWVALLLPLSAMAVICRYGGYHGHVAGALIIVGCGVYIAMSFFGRRSVDGK